MTRRAAIRDSGILRQSNRVDWCWPSFRYERLHICKALAGALLLVLAVGSPALLAQNKQPNNLIAQNTGSTTAEGKILWQYNTDG